MHAQDGVGVCLHLHPQHSTNRLPDNLHSEQICQQPVCSVSSLHVSLSETYRGSAAPLHASPSTQPPLLLSHKQLLPAPKP
jgi:hypothetical protein